MKTQGAFLEKLFFWLKETNFAFLLYALLIVLIFSIGLLCAVPPISKDALIHHLAVPRLYLNHGGIYEIPSMVYAYYPMNLQMLYMAALYFGSDIAPKFIHFSFALLTTGLIFSYLKQRLHAFYGLLGVVFFLSIPIVIKLSITAYIDLGLILFSTASILLIFKWVESGFRQRHLILSAVFCGLAMGTKYNGLVVCCILTLFVPFVYSRFNRNRHFAGFKAVQQGAVFLTIALLIFSPWAIRNWHWTGNPIYPLYGGILSQARTAIKKFNIPSKQTAPPAAEKSSQTQEYREPGPIEYRRLIHNETGLDILLLPVRVFFQGRDGDPKYFDGKLNPFLLIFPLFAFLRRSSSPNAFENREKWFLVWFCVLYFSIALFTSVMRIRYIAPIIPPLVILSIYGIRNIFEYAKNMDGFLKNMSLTAAGIALFLCFGINAGYLAGQFAYVKPFSFLSGELNRHEYIEQYRFEYPAMRFINENLPEDARIYFLFLGKRGYYCDREYLPENTYNFLDIVRRSETSQDMLKGLKDQGSTHMLIQMVFFNKWVAEEFRPDEIKIIGAFFKNHVMALYSKNDVTLFALKE